nr:hypothetical protein [Methylocapsa acidiphila]
MADFGFAGDVDNRNRVGKPISDKSHVGRRAKDYAFGILADFYHGDDLQASRVNQRNRARRLIGHENARPIRRRRHAIGHIANRHSCDDLQGVGVDDAKVIAAHISDIDPTQRWRKRYSERSFADGNGRDRCKRIGVAHADGVGLPIGCEKPPFCVVEHETSRRTTDRSLLYDSARPYIDFRDDVTVPIIYENVTAIRVNRDSKWRAWIGN